MNRQREYPTSKLPDDYQEYMHIFFALKDLCGDCENPITPDLIRQWGEHTYREFERWERTALLEMDAAFRRARMEVVKWHQTRTQVKADPDLERMSSGRRGNSRI